ncbi:hypothetical protein LFL96_07590 [Paraburkholderia sp. D15]|uniref:hypothetical protein n=1 Tax=Paraburkholderia sp. D15 TaxID=2880218 RepID=UPI00247A6759|nr:hypothetical protein [Paraburkholderia sp. D15]WGS51354.1 hypothetical protein LFL96_07590 [Paraburkholderia sp. D15]WKF59313.1 hypothetical protein HUO10_003822 [Paraburkholderia busanensis]
MKRAFISLGFALVLTLPLSIAIGRNPWFADWMASGNGWHAFEPLLRLCGAVGVEDDENIVINVILIVSFALSLVLVGLARRIAGRYKSGRGAR